jgi:ribosomal protein L25 (general stress protein Ctc)
VNEKQIEIKYNNQKIKILIKDIKEMKILTMNDTESEIEQFFKGYIIIGDTPKYCMQLIKIDGEKILIGRNTFEYFVELTKAIESASIHYHNCFSNSSFDGIIIRENSCLFATCNILVKNSFNIIDLIVNKEKRKIFLKDFKEKKLKEIIENIIEYKSCFKRNKYHESIHKIINIFGIIEKMTKEERDNYEKIINKETIDKLVDINNKIKEIWDTKNSNIDKDESKVKELKKIINLYTFDGLFVGIKDEYISSYYDELKNDNKYPQIKQNFKLILGRHFIDSFGMNKEKDFQCLGSDDVENIAKNATDEEKRYRAEKYNAFFI